MGGPGSESWLRQEGHHSADAPLNREAKMKWKLQMKGHRCERIMVISFVKIGGPTSNNVSGLMMVADQEKLCSHGSTTKQAIQLDNTAYRIYSIENVSLSTPVLI